MAGARATAASRLHPRQLSPPRCCSPPRPHPQPQSPPRCGSPARGNSRPGPSSPARCAAAHSPSRLAPSSPASVSSQARPRGSPSSPPLHSVPPQPHPHPSQSLQSAHHQTHQTQRLEAQHQTAPVGNSPGAARATRVGAGSVVGAAGSVVGQLAALASLLHGVGAGTISASGAGQQTQKPTQKRGAGSPTLQLRQLSGQQHTRAAPASASASPPPPPLPPPPPPPPASPPGWQRRGQATHQSPAHRRPATLQAVEEYQQLQQYMHMQEQHPPNHHHHHHQQQQQQQQQQQLDQQEQQEQDQQRGQDWKGSQNQQPVFLAPRPHPGQRPLGTAHQQEQRQPQQQSPSPGAPSLLSSLVDTLFPRPLPLPRRTCNNRDNRGGPGGSPPRQRWGSACGGGNRDSASRDIGVAGRGGKVYGTRGQPAAAADIARAAPSAGRRRPRPGSAKGLSAGEGERGRHVI